MSDADRDLSQPDPRLEAWGGSHDAPELTDEQAAALQQREEPVAAADFGLPLTGDVGRAEGASESADAPETLRPDTSLGHEGGKRYEDYAGGAGGSA